MSFRSGLVALVGCPNAGKSSLLNALVGERIAAVSSRPQTTRNRVVGIWSTPRSQVVLLDTPGLHEAWTPMNQKLVDTAVKVLEEVDAAAWIVDVASFIAAQAAGGTGLDADLSAVLARLKSSGLPWVVVLNKIDLVPGPSLLPVIEVFAQHTAHIVPVSARRRAGVDALEGVLARMLPEQVALYPQDQLTDQTERFIVSELIREQVFACTTQEVPYATAVEVERFDESAREAGQVHIHAKVIVEKESQKAILIGRGGKMIKRIGTEARKRIEQLLGCKVRLDLFVVVERDWTRNPRLLRELGVG